MRRRSRRSELAASAGPPEGPEWHALGDAHYARAGGGAQFVVEASLRRELEGLARAAASGPDWSRARAALECLVRLRAGLDPPIEIGRVRRLGDGLSRVAFVADVEVAPDPTGICDTYVILALRQGSSPDAAGCMLRELEILDHLGSLKLSLRIPAVLGALWCEGQLFVVEGYIDGYPVDLRASRAGPVPPWEVVGRVAAGIHGIDPEPLRRSFGKPCSWRGHVEQMLPVLEAVDAPEAAPALAWVRGHLPEQTPGVLLHGDLLGQNILAPLFGAQDGFGVLDWEHAGLGHPAYDLAIVTRGHRRPFQTQGGLRRLLVAYRDAGGSAIPPAEVHLFEILLVAGWYRDACNRESRHSPEQYRRILSGVLERARGASP